MRSTRGKQRPTVLSFSHHQPFTCNLQVPNEADILASSMGLGVGYDTICRTEKAASFVLDRLSAAADAAGLSVRPLKFDFFNTSIYIYIY